MILFNFEEVVDFMHALWANFLGLFDVLCPPKYPFCHEVKNSFWPILKKFLEIVTSLAFYKYIALIWFIYAMVASMVYLAYTRGNRRSSYVKKKKVLFVTTKLGDECLFGPTLTDLVNTCELYLLCITGDPSVQKRPKPEALILSCDILGIPSYNVEIITLYRTRNNSRNKWNVFKISRILAGYIKALKFHELYILDKGLSGCKQSDILFDSFVNLRLKKTIPAYCDIFILENVNTFRKGIQHLDIIPSALFTVKENLYVCSVKEYNDMLMAMNCYESRVGVLKIIIVANSSRYFFINTYKKLDKRYIALNRLMD